MTLKLIIHCVSTITIQIESVALCTQRKIACPQMSPFSFKSRVSYVWSYIWIFIGSDWRATEKLSCPQISLLLIYLKFPHPSLTWALQVSATVQTGYLAKVGCFYIPQFEFIASTNGDRHKIQMCICTERSPPGAILQISVYVLNIHICLYIYRVCLYIK